MQGILDASLLLFHLNLGHRANLDHCDTTSEFCHPLLHFFLVVIRSGFFDLNPNLINTAFDGLRASSTINNGRVLLRYLDTLSIT